MLSKAKHLFLFILLCWLTPARAQLWDSIPGSDSVITATPKSLTLFRDKLYLVQTEGLARKLICWDGNVLRTIYGWEQFGYIGPLGSLLTATNTHLFFYARKDNTATNERIYIAYDGKEFKKVAEIKGLTFGSGELFHFSASFKNEFYYLGTDTSSGSPVKKLYKYNGVSSSIVLDNVTELALYQEFDGSLYAKGTIKPGASTLTGVLKYDGSEWSLLSPQPDGGGDCSGVYQNNLVLGGGNPTNPVNIVKVWNGVAWSGISDPVQIEMVYDIEEHKSNLYAIAGGYDIGDDNVFRYNGATWAKLNNQEFVTQFDYPYLTSLAIWKDELYVTGKFDIKETDIKQFARIKLLNPVNLGCVALDDRDTLIRGDSLEINVQVNDSDSNGDYMLTSVLIGPKLGTVTVTSADRLHYVSDPDTFGRDTIRYKICDQGGLCDSAYVFIEVQEDPNGIAVYASRSLKAYPNPASGSSVTIRSATETQGALYLYDLTGKTLLCERFSGTTHVLNLSEIPSGMYSLQLVTDKGVFRQKLIRQ